MNKKEWMALAVAGALATPLAAFAQASSVQIYGRANVGRDNYSATGATAGSAFDFKGRNRIYDSFSRLGFRGSENLGNGLEAVFLIESGVNFDTGSGNGQSGQPNAATGTLGSRLGHVGLASSEWGQLTFGKSNVFWVNGPIEQIGANYVNLSAFVSSGIFGRGMSVGVARQNNVVQYTSPVISGFNAVISYMPNSEAQPAGQDADAKIWGVTLQRHAGAFPYGYDFAKNWGSTPSGGSQPVTTGHKLRAGWAYQPGAMLGVLWLKTVKDNGAAGAQTVDAASPSLSQTAWGVTWEHYFGNVQALAQWFKIPNIGGCVTAGACSNTNAVQWMVGARYTLSKRTNVYVTYNTARNASNYNLDYAVAGMSSAAAGGLPTTSSGADPRIWALGMMHNF